MLATVDCTFNSVAIITALAVYVTSFVPSCKKGTQNCQQIANFLLSAKKHCKLCACCWWHLHQQMQQQPPHNNQPTHCQQCWHKKGKKCLFHTLHFLCVGFEDSWHPLEVALSFRIQTDAVHMAVKNSIEQMKRFDKETLGATLAFLMIWGMTNKFNECIVVREQSVTREFNPAMIEFGEKRG